MSAVPVCPSGEKCQCAKLADEPEWDTDENRGYHKVMITLSNETVASKVWHRSDPNRSKILLSTLYNFERHLKGVCRDLLRRPDTYFEQLVETYNAHIKPRFKNNRSKHVQYDSISYLRGGLQLLIDTHHSIQELDPESPYFQAVNKPRSLKYIRTAEPHGDDQRLRSLCRHIVIKLNAPIQYTLCLFIHELAHTPANHVCFRHDDHKHDFRIFQALFLDIAVRDGFISEAQFV